MPLVPNRRTKPHHQVQLTKKVKKIVEKATTKVSTSDALEMEMNQKVHNAYPFPYGSCTLRQLALLDIFPYIALDSIFKVCAFIFMQSVLIDMTKKSTNKKRNQVVHIMYTNKGEVTVLFIIREKYQIIYNCICINKTRGCVYLWSL